VLIVIHPGLTIVDHDGARAGGGLAPFIAIWLRGQVTFERRFLDGVQLWWRLHDILIWVICCCSGGNERQNGRDRHCCGGDTVRCQVFQINRVDIIRTGVSHDVQSEGLERWGSNTDYRKLIIFIVKNSSSWQWCNGSERGAKSLCEYRYLILFTATRRG